MRSCHLSFLWINEYCSWWWWSLIKYGSLPTFLRTSKSQIHISAPQIHISVWPCACYKFDLYCIVSLPVFVISSVFRAIMFPLSRNLSCLTSQIYFQILCLSFAGKIWFVVPSFPVSTEHCVALTNVFASTLHHYTAYILSDSTVLSHFYLLSNKCFGIIYDGYALGRPIGDALG